ncbi:MAG: N-acetyltransferase [Gemmatimonas sp.]|nr:N-acetyltransferase [Gemmatimonas sp.]
MIVQISPRWVNAALDLSSESAVATTQPVGDPPRNEPVGEIVVRPAKISDMRDVEPLIRHFAEHNLMLPKGYDDLARNFREFIVACDESGRVAACGALRVYGEGLAEVCSLAVDPPLQRAGLGRQVVVGLLESARDLGIARVFALTLNPAFFGRLGFETVPKDEFPQKVWADCRSCPKLHACDEIAVALDI